MKVRQIIELAFTCTLISVTSCSSTSLHTEKRGDPRTYKVINGERSGIIQAFEYEEQTVIQFAFPPYKHVPEVTGKDGVLRIGKVTESFIFIDKDPPFSVKTFTGTAKIR